MKKIQYYCLFSYLFTISFTLQAQQISPTLIIGVWESTDVSSRAVFENGRVIYTETDPMLYKIEGRKILYSNGKTHQIVHLSFQKFTEKTEAGLIHWKRVIEIPANYSRLLQGSWIYKPTPQGMPSFFDFKGNKVDMGMMGLYRYQVQQNTLKFFNIKNGADFSQKLVSLSKNRLVLLSSDGTTIETYQKK